MDKVKIPKTFDLFGSTWKVLWNNQTMNDHERYGQCSYGEKEITLSTTQGVDKLSSDKINQTFYHELVHAILDSMNEYELSRNEKFVNTFSELLHQALKTFKY